MKAEELMIGDWVYNTHNRQNERVAEIGSGLVMLDYNDLYEYDEIEPIPITPEILEANGWVYFHPQGIKGTMMLAIGGHAVLCWDSETKELILTGGSILKVCYIHELQHVLRLCGIEKEIIVKQ